MISIITITKDNASGLRKTLDSIRRLEGARYEVHIIDGNSRDDSEALVAERKDDRISFHQDRKTGIYPAMNDGIAFASGEWLLFMNAGDCFASPTVLSEILPSLRDEFDFVHGNTRTNTGRIKHPYRQLQEPWREMPFCHQAVFNHKRVFGKRSFDESFRIAGDLEFYLWAIRNRYRFHYVDMDLAISEDGGVSEVQALERVRECYRAARRHYPLHPRMHIHYYRKTRSIRTTDPMAKPAV